MSVLELFNSIEHSSLGEGIQSSLWLFPVIESFHLLALAVIGGSVLVVDMRLFGLGLRGRPVKQLWLDTRPWFIASLIVMLISGSLLFSSEATKCYYHDAFWMKMSCLLLAIIFTFTVKRRVSMAEENRVSPLWNKVVAIVSIGLWTGVGIGGRWIGFS